MATDASARAPDYVINVDGTDITPTVEKRFISLELSEGRGDESDQLTITLDDSDGRLAMTAIIREVFAKKPSEFDPRKYLGPAREGLIDLIIHKNSAVLGSAGRYHSKR